MKVEVHREGTSWGRDAEAALRRCVRRTEARAKRYPEYWSELDVHIGHAVEDIEEVELSLVLSGHEIRVDRYGRRLPLLIEDAFEHLFKKFDAYRLQANPALRRRVRGRVERARPDDGIDAVLAQRIYPVLLRAAEHEIAVRQVDGDLEPGLVDPVELADMALAEGWGELESGIDPAEAAARLEERLIVLLERLSESLHEHEEQDVSLDAEVADFAVSQVGQELQELWTLDEVAFEETLADPEEDIEALWARQELRDVLTRALFQLPRSQRRVFSQAVIDGWAPDALAAALGREQVTLEAEVDAAAHELAHRLSTRTTTWSADRVREVYAALGQRLRDERRELSPIPTA